MSQPDFGILPDEYKHLLVLAKEQHNLDVTPLQELRGGQTGAFLYLVSVCARDSRQVEHLVLKFDRINEKARTTEIERHQLALKQAPEAFAEENMASLAYDFEHEGATALFYTIAGQSLQHFRTLASNTQQSSLETLFGATNDYLLKEWNKESTFEQALHPKKMLEKWLGYRLKPEGHIASFLKDEFHIDPDTEGFLIQEQIFPNPLSYGLNAGLWKDTRSIDVLTGFQHGDLNIGNIMSKFAEDSEKLEGYFLIDFALYKAGMPLLYDNCYLEMSYLIRELDRAPFQKWVSLIMHFSNRDIPNPKEVPVELAGACAVINSGRKSFEHWVNETHQSLSDDLWGQFWLAAVAAGLNFCNKTVLPTEARLAGLIYSAAHLKRYCVQFGVPLPVEVRLLYDASKWGEIAKINKSVSATNKQRINLPNQPTQFIGRQVELKAVKDLLMQDNVPLVTVIGPGGTGKTRLAIQAAAELIDQFEGGVYFVDLAPIHDPDSVLSTIARTVGSRETSDRPLLDELKGHFGSQKLLLLLDNFEQVTAAGPNVVELLRDCPNLKLLVTTREALHLRGEHICPVPPLALPHNDLDQQSMEQLTQFEAVQLFIERALEVKPDFEVTNHNAPAVAEICVRLDGLPLAIELAAARIRMLSPQALLERVKSRLKLLRGGSRDLPLRQQTLRDTINWSYELLDTEEQRLFALLSVFPSCTYEAVEEVARSIDHLDDMGIDILDGLTSLMDKSLIRKVDQDTGEPRLLMLETIREFASERLEDDPDFSAAVCRSHATYFTEFTQRKWENLSGHGREAALEEMESEIENLQTMWHYWVAEGNFEQLRKLTDCLCPLYDARGWYHAMVDLTTDLLNVLASTTSTPELVQQEIMLRTSLARALMAIKGCTQEVEEIYTRALELCQGQGEIPQLFPVLRALSSFYIYVAEFEKGVRMGEQILELAERNDDANMRVEGHLVVGYNLAFFKDLSLGLEHLEKGISYYDPNQHRSGRFRLGNNPGVACLTTSALFLWMHGFPDRALKRAEEAVNLADMLNHPFSMAYALFHSALLHLWRREMEQVEDRAKTVLEIAEEHDFQIWKAVATCLHGAGLAGMGIAEEGLIEINRGMELYKGMKTPPVFWPLLLLVQAGTYSQAERPEEGLTLLDKAMEIVTPGSANPISSEICRLKGDLLIALSPENPVEAESWFRQALEVAQKRQARMMELRAAMSLYQLYRDQGKTDQGRQLLNDSYEKFTEGFATSDLKEAKALLEDLS